MREYTLTHLTDAVLLRELTGLVSRDRETTAMLLAHIAEVDARRAYVPEGYSSMFSYCVEFLRLSEDAASKRIHAARAARLVPALFDALAKGELHLSAVWLLAPHITPDNAEELIEAASHRRKSEVEAFLARRFPTSGVRSPLTRITPVGSVPASCGGAGLFDEHAPGHVTTENGRDGHAPGHTATMMERDEHAPGHTAAEDECDEHAPGHVRVDIGGAGPAPGHGEKPMPERYFVQVTIARTTYDKLRHAQALLSHAVPSGDVAQVLDRALDALIARVERRKFGAAPRAEARPVHRNAVARRTTMAPREVPVAPVAASQARQEQAKDLMAGLRGLGCRADEARRAVEYAMTIEGATFEDRLRAALAFRSHRTATRSKFTEACQVRERRAHYGPLAWERRGSDTRPFERPGRRGSSNVTGWALCHEHALRSTMPACEPRAS